MSVVPGPGNPYYGAKGAIIQIGLIDCNTFGQAYCDGDQPRIFAAAGGCNQAPFAQNLGVAPAGGITFAVRHIGNGTYWLTAQAQSGALFQTTVPETHSATSCWANGDGPIAMQIMCERWDPGDNCGGNSPSDKLDFTTIRYQKSVDGQWFIPGPNNPHNIIVLLRISKNAFWLVSPESIGMPSNAIKDCHIFNDTDVQTAPGPAIETNGSALVISNLAIEYWYNEAIKIYGDQPATIHGLHIEGHKFTSDNKNLVYVGDRRLEVVGCSLSGDIDYVDAVVPARLFQVGSDASLSLRGVSGTWSKTQGSNVNLVGVDSGARSVVIEDIDLGANVTIPSDNAAVFPLITQWTSGKANRSARGTTAQRPTAAAAGAGGQFYDTDLTMPIWSTGTIWTDAAGASA